MIIIFCAYDYLEFSSHKILFVKSQSNTEKIWFYKTKTKQKQPQPPKENPIKQHKKKEKKRNPSAPPYQQAV